MRNKRLDHDLSTVVLDDQFIAAATRHEPSARERLAQVQRLPGHLPEAGRRRRGRDGRRAVSNAARKWGLGGVLLAGMVVMVFAGLGTAVPNDPRPRQVRAVYAVPSDISPDPAAVEAIRRDIQVTQDWLAAQTGGRSIRFAQRDGATAVDTTHLTVTAAQLRGRPDASGLVDDEFRGRGTPDEFMLIFVPLRFSEQVRCGEGSPGFALVWMGSCGQTPSTATATFGDGTTSTIAHELMHALGAVQPCAPHYGSHGHVTDDPRDLLYDGPLASDEIVLDPGRDDYYATGNPDCADVAAHPAWQRHRR